MRKGTALLAALTLLATLFATVPLGAQSEERLEERSGPERLSGAVSDSMVTGPDDLVQVFIELEAPSVAARTAQAGISAAEQRAHGRAVQQQQDRVRDRLGGLIQEELSRLVVAANGFRARVRVGDIPAISVTEGVRNVAPVTRYELLNETSVPWIGGEAVQQSGYTGDGVSIAIIDTGIDYTHAALGGSGDPADYEQNDPGVVEAGTFPTAKVVGGFDFAGPTYDASNPDLDTPSPDADPLDVNGHGTHVAATAAGVGTADVGEGMAPDAELYAYKVFGDQTGSTDLVADAIERALDPNNDLSMDDAVDVINMSLGADFGPSDDPSAIAAQNAVDNGVVVVAASGNSGSVPYVTGSPAVADDVISVAASIDQGVEVLGIEVLFPGAGESEQLEAQPGDFGDLSEETTATLAAADPLDACTEITNDLSGHIALIQRGVCTFTTKVRAAQQAGAEGVVVFNNVPEPPIAMGHDGTDPQPDIPAVMVSLADGERLLDALGDGDVTVTLSNQITIPKPELADHIADFSSRGPGFGNAFKPDLAAPGFSIDSAAVGSGDGAALSSGTSMATPHVAGAAAQLLDWQSDLTPNAIKSLLMSSAVPASGPDDPVPVTSQGTGVVRVDRAVEDLEAYASPTGLAFYFNPTEATDTTRTVDLTVLDETATYDVAIEDNRPLDGVSWDVSADQVSTTGGGASVDVTVSVDPAALPGDDGFFSQAESDGWLVFSNTGDANDTIRVGLVAVADPASSVTAAGGEETVAIANDGPGDGFADGFTHLGAGAGSLVAVGYRTGTADDGAGPYRTIDFGMALQGAWSSPSALEVNLLFDVDEDGNADYALLAADLGLLQGADPTGQLATAIIDLSTQAGTIIYFAIGDLNDRVLMLPADLTGDFGFLEDSDDGFDMSAVVLEHGAVVGVAENIRVDLDSEITSPDGLSLEVPAGANDALPIDGGGDMLWLFQNNQVTDQVTVTTVSTTPPPEEDPPGEEPPGEEPPPPSFDDVPAGHLFHTEIVWLAEQGITRGCNPPANDMFCPDDPVTRGQMAAFLNRALDLAPAGDDFFVDDDESVFEGDIDRLAEAGITRGCNPPANDQFCPTAELTRAEMATFMMRGFEFSDGAGTDRFVDDDGNIHEDAIDVIATADVTRGCNPPANDMYCPAQDITRGQMAAFIYRAFRSAGSTD